VPRLEPEVEVVVRLEDEPRDLGVVAEPGVAVAARVPVVGVEVRPGDPEAGLAAQQRQHPDVGADRLPEQFRAAPSVADQIRRRRRRLEARAVDELLAKVGEPVEDGLPVGFGPVGQQCDQCGRPIVERERTDQVAAEPILGVAVVARRTRVFGRLLVEQVLEGDRDLPADPGKPRRTTDEIVFSLVVDLDDVLVVELADLAVLTLRRKREVGDQLGVASAKVGVVGVEPGDVGVAHREIQLRHRSERRFVGCLDQRGRFVVRLDGVHLVEPKRRSIDPEPEPRALDARQPRQRVAEVPEIPLVDVNQPTSVTGETTSNRPSLSRKTGISPR